MENTVKHFNWTSINKNDEEEFKGRLAVKISNFEFSLKVIFGNAPPVEILPHIFSEIPEISEYGDRNNTERQNPYAVEKRVGMSGSMDALLIECQDQELKIFPVRGRLHVSMYGKLNQDISLWPGDFVILADAINYQEDIVFWLDEAEIFEPKVWKQPDAAIQPGPVVQTVKIGCQSIEIYEKFLKWNGWEFWPGNDHEGSQYLRDHHADDADKFNEIMNPYGWYANDGWLLSRKATCAERKAIRTTHPGPIVEIIRRSEEK